MERPINQLIYPPKPSLLHVVVPFIIPFKDLIPTVAKGGSVFIGLMIPDGAIWFRYQRTVLMR